MPITVAALRKFAGAMLQMTLAYDNQLLGLVLLAIAVDDWRTLVGKYHRLEPFIAMGLYATPAVSLLVIALSAIYLTSVSLIMLTATRPLARYETLTPNLLAVFAAFSVYCFSFLPPAEVRSIPVVVPLAVMALGGAIVLFCLITLRRAFSVTPQARYLVRTGPYAIVRHPMYVGNIITMFGLALLVGTFPAIAVFMVTAALQICRGFLEDRLLEKSLPDYAAYMNRVGGFMPRWFKRNTDVKSLAAMLILLSVPLGHALAQGAGVGVTAAPLRGGILAAPRERAPSSLPVIKVQAGDMAGNCQAWYAKALSGAWFTADEAKKFASTEDQQENLNGIPACRNLFTLQNKCSDIAESYETESIKASTMLGRVEATPGCKSIVGLGLICQALTEVPRGSLSASRKAILSDCQDKSVADGIGDFLRPAL